MHWLIKCRSKPDTDALRLATIDAHQEFSRRLSRSHLVFRAVVHRRQQERHRQPAADRVSGPGRRPRLYQCRSLHQGGHLPSRSPIERWKPGLDVRQRDYARKDGTMQFVIHCHDKPDGGARRAPLRDAHHRVFTRPRANIIVARGPLLDDDGVKTIGSVLILDVADKAEAAAFWADEPFNRAGVYECDDGALALRPRVSGALLTSCLFDLPCARHQPHQSHDR